MKTKLFSGAVVADTTLGDRQIRIIANSGKADRVHDILPASGCQLQRYKKNPIVLANHDHQSPIGTAEVYAVGDQLMGILTFAPAGVSPIADEFCGLSKAGVLVALSVGFKGLEYKPNSEGGLTFTKWELLEISVVAVGCDPDALVIERSMRKSGRVLSSANAAALAAARKCLSKSAAAHKDALELLKKSDRHRARAATLAATVASSAGNDDDDYVDPDDDGADVELAYRVPRARASEGDQQERERRLRMIEVAKLALEDAEQSSRITEANALMPPYTPHSVPLSNRGAALANLDRADVGDALTEEQIANQRGGHWLIEFKKKQEDERLRSWRLGVTA